MPDPHTWSVVVTDRYGFVMSPDEAKERARDVADTDADDYDPDGYPNSVSIVRGSALPSPPDSYGLNSRLPGTHLVADVLFEDDRLADMDVDDLERKLDDLVAFAAAAGLAVAGV